MSFGRALDIWQAGWDFRLDGLIRAVNAFVRRAELDKDTTPQDESIVGHAQKGI